MFLGGSALTSQEQVTNVLDAEAPQSQSGEARSLGHLSIGACGRAPVHLATQYFLSTMPPCCIIYDGCDHEWKVLHMLLHIALSPKRRLRRCQSTSCCQDGLAAVSFRSRICCRCLAHSKLPTEVRYIDRRASRDVVEVIFVSASEASRLWGKSAGGLKSLLTFS